MEIVRTIKLKLNIDKSIVQPTIDLFTKAYNEVCKVSYTDRDTNGVSLHHKTYYPLKSFTSLPSELLIQSRIKATETMKAIAKLFNKGKTPKCPVSKQCSIRYCKGSLSIFWKKNLLSILLKDGRTKIPFKLPNYYLQYKDWNFQKGAELFIKDNKVYLALIVTKEVPETPLNGDCVGIDRGIINIAVTSDRKFYNSNHLKTVRHHREFLKSVLQSCGSKSAKRHLSKLSGKVKRFVRDTNHCIAKDIVSVEPGTTIVLEDLKKVQGRRGKVLNKMLGNWSFFQLEQFITEKAERKGVNVIKINPAYTSQTCSKCGAVDKSFRSGSNFQCSCGYQLNADLNAAYNIRNLGKSKISRLLVNQPIVGSATDLFASGSTSSKIYRELLTTSPSIDNTKARASSTKFRLLKDTHYNFR
jgi:putative transposase